MTSSASTAQPARSSSHTTAVRPAGAADAPRLARAMAAAFHDDPVFAWFFPHVRGAEDRARRYERFFRLLALPATLPAGVSATTDGVVGGALWTPPGEAHASTWEQVRMLPALARVAGRDLPRALKGMGAMERVHPHEEHWYLWLLGVAPANQGRGIGSALLQPILDRADAEELPAYLEATTPESRALYERHGFVTRDVLELPAGGPPLWLMWREPRG